MPKPKPAGNAARNAELAAIHMAAEQIGMDTKDKNPDSEYRRLLWTIGRQHSAAALDFAGRRRVLDHLRKLTGGNEWGWVNTMPEDRRKMLWKIRRICMERGIRQGGHIAYAEGVASHISGIARTLRMMDHNDLWLVVKALNNTLKNKRAQERRDHPEAQP